jgi:hypothetical protein
MIHKRPYATMFDGERLRLKLSRYGGNMVKELSEEACEYLPPMRSLYEIDIYQDDDGIWRGVHTAGVIYHGTKTSAHSIATRAANSEPITSSRSETRQPWCIGRVSYDLTDT